MSIATVTRCGAESFGGFLDELGPADGRRIDRDLRDADVHQALDVRDAADSPADGQRDRDPRDGARDGVQQRLALFDRGRNVEEDEFIGAGLAVGGGVLGRIAHVFQVDEIHALDQSAVLDVQARDNATVVHVRILVWESHERPSDPGTRSSRYSTRRSARFQAPRGKHSSTAATNSSTLAARDTRARNFLAPGMPGT